MAETADEPEPVKTCVLKASIHCEGCKRKVKKILSQVQGVEFVDVDTKQQKVTVSGSVDADTLIKKLVKSGKNAQLWPQKAEKIPGNEKYKEKETHQTQRKMDNQEANPTSENDAKDPGRATKDELPAKKCEGSEGPAKAADDGGATKSNEESGGGSSGGASKVFKDASVKTSSAVQETKTEEKKTEEGCSAAVDPPQAEEKKDAVEKSNVGTSSKKKKKKGQSGNLSTSAPSSAAFRGLENQEPGPPPPTNHFHPRHHHYPPPGPPHHHYTPPPGPPHHHYAPPPPVSVVSYNTAYPSSSYTASYYTAPPPPYSYAYTHPGVETQPPPSDLDPPPRQPLDSFEIFSDENPNGCFIM